jgi:hypothetical protein
MKKKRRGNGFIWRSSLVVILCNMQTTIACNIVKKWPAGELGKKIDVAPRRTPGVDDSSEPGEIVSGSGVFAVILSCTSAVVCGIYGGLKNGCISTTPGATG